MPLKKKTRLGLTIAGVIAGLVLVAVVGVYLYLHVGLSGGPSQYLKRFARKPDPAKLAPERTASGRELRRSLDRLVGSLHLTPASPEQEAVADQCYAGQHNFMRKDPYAYRCSLCITRYYGADGDFRQFLVDLEQQVRSQGWTGRDLSRIVTDYFDRYYGPPRKLEPKPDNLRPPGVYLVSDLPEPIGYHKDGLELSVGYPERVTTDLQSLGYLQTLNNVSLSPFFDRQDPVDVGAVFRSVTAAHPYLIGIAAQTDYFEK